jgi:hypothetical protein
MASNCESPKHASDVSKEESDAGILSSHGVLLDVPGLSESEQPPIVQQL